MTKRVNQDEFYSLPPGTWYIDDDMYHTPFILEDIKCKGDTIYDKDGPIDYFYTEFFDCFRNKDINARVSFMTNLIGNERDGQFREEATYIILHPMDVLRVMRRTFRRLCREIMERTNINIKV